jgi:hypothetical protein
MKVNLYINLMKELLIVLEDLLILVIFIANE